MKKKLCIIFLYVLIIVNIFAEKVGILSFNINGSFSGNLNVNNNVWVTQIISILSEPIKTDNDMADIILLQEFPIKNHDKTLINKILEGLGNNSWSYYCTDKYLLPGEKANQNSIVFYKVNTILPCPEGDELINFNEEEPSYKFAKNNYQIIHFCLSSNQTKDFIIVNVHAPYNDIEKRKADLEQLKCMYNDLKKDYKVIIGGDFNTYREELLSVYFPGEYIDGEWGRYFFTSGNQTRGLLTTLRKNSEPRRISLASDYDHFVISSGIEVSKEMKHSFYQGNDYGSDSYGRIKLGNKFYTSNQEIMKEVSDHLPVFIELDF